MSNSIQAVQRLEPDDQLVGGVARESVRHSERPARGGEDGPAAARAPAAPIEAPGWGATHGAAAAAVAGLLERLRALAAPDDAARVLVFTPVTAECGVRAVIDGLAVRARELALRVSVGELTRTGGQAVLGERGATTRRVLELDGAALAPALTSWLAHLDGAHLVLIEAPPVATSADALLLAGACDGLVLVAATGVTARAALRGAAERAAAAGCRTLGVVLTTS